MRDLVFLFGSGLCFGVGIFSALAALWTKQEYGGPYTAPAYLCAAALLFIATK